MQSLEPLWGNVVLRLDERIDKSEGGIIVPEPARELKLSGTVMAAGPGPVDVNGVFHPSDLESGDKVVFGRHLGYHIPLNDEKLYMIPEKHIYAVYGENEELAELVDLNPDARFEYLHVDFPDWEKSRDPVLDELTAEEWVPFAVVKGTTTLRKMCRDTSYWTRKWNATTSQPVADDEPDLDISKYDIKVLNINVSKIESFSPEKIQFETLINAGWEIHSCIDTEISVLIESMRRLK